MNPSRIQWITVLIAVLGLIGILKIRSRLNQPPPPDEKAAGLALLAEKLSGPRYFTSTTQEEGQLWIRPQDAVSQLPRIMAERKLGPDANRKIHDLIDRLTVPPASRMVGGERINLLQLNLALDSIH